MMGRCFCTSATLSSILIEQIQVPRSGPARPRNFREATSFPPISIFLPLQFYYSL